MHRYRIVAQISLILSILNLVLAAPIVVQEIHKARGDDSKTAAAEDVPAMPETSDGLETSDGPTSPPPSPDAMASPQHSPLSDGSTSSGYPTPYLSSGSSGSGYSWLRDRPPRLSLNLPASLPEPGSLQQEPGSPQQEPTSPQDEPGSPHSSSSGPSELPLPSWYLQALEPQRGQMPQSPPRWWEWSPPHSSSGSLELLLPAGSGSSEMQPPASVELPPEIPQSTPAWWHWPSPHSSNPGPSEAQPPASVELPPEIPQPPPAWWHWPSPRPSSPGPSEVQPPASVEFPPEIPQSHPGWWEWTPPPSSSGSSEIPLPEYVELPPEVTQSPPAWWQWPSPHHSNSGPSEIPSSAQLAGSDGATTDTYSSQDEFTPSHHLSSSTDWNSGESIPTPYSSASDGSLSSHYFSASDELVPSHEPISMPSQHSMPEGLASSLTPDGSPPSLTPDGSPPSLTPDGSPPSHSSPPTQTPPDSAGFFNENMIRKLKIFAGVIVTGGTIASIAGSSQIKNRDCQDS